VKTRLYAEQDNVSDYEDKHKEVEAFLMQIFQKMAGNAGMPPGGDGMPVRDVSSPEAPVSSDGIKLFLSGSLPGTICQYSTAATA